MAQTYIAATFGSMVSQLAMRGILGGAGRADMTNTILSGLQVGTNFVAYPIAIQLLRKHSQKFRENMDDPHGKKFVTYLAGGAVAAGIVTAVNYPLTKIMAWHNHQKADKHTPSIFGFYADQIGSSIGFAATMGTLSPIVPVYHDSLSTWIRTNLLVNASNIGGKLFSYPIHHLRYGTTLSSMITGYMKAIPAVIITGDATNQIKDTIAFIAE